MKIFAKRKKKTTPSKDGIESSQQQNDGEADKAVEELLKLDPKKLNSKERRMIRRYEERNKESSSNNMNDTGETKKEKTLSSKSDSQCLDPTDGNTKAEQQNAEVEEESCSKDSQEVEGGASDEESIREQIPENDEEGNSEEEKPSDENQANASESGVSKEEVLKLLEKLNSKQRRKLNRQLERDGDDAVSQVMQEATKLLQEAEENKNPPVQTSDNKNTPETSDEQKDGKEDSKGKGKKRKKDWSDLTPEERLRREEQRQKQKEAAERREREANDPNFKKASKHAHPLNSERRRANRRKPKWTSPKSYRSSSALDGNNEHNTSGYHMRKITRADKN